MQFASSKSHAASHRSNTVRCFTIRARDVEIVSRVCKNENPGYPGFLKL